jgi:hypothetical protein
MLTFNGQNVAALRSRLVQHVLEKYIGCNFNVNDSRGYQHIWTAENRPIMPVEPEYEELPVDPFSSHVRRRRCDQATSQLSHWQ